MDKEIHVSITPGTVFTTLFIIAGAYIFWLLRDLALLVLTAIVIASAIEPGVAFFIRQHIPRFIAALLVYVLTFGSVFSLLYFFFPPIIADAAGFISAMPKYLDTLNATSGLSGIASATDFIGGGQQGSQSFMQTQLSLHSVFAASSGGVLQIFITFFGGIFSLMLVIV